MRGRALDYVFPAASVLIAAFLGIHLATGHARQVEQRPAPRVADERAALGSTALPGPSSSDETASAAPPAAHDRLAGVDTAALSRIRLPVATPSIAFTSAPDEPGIHTVYYGVAALRSWGLEVSMAPNEPWPGGKTDPSPQLAWSIRALVDVRLALAEPAPTGWRIAVVGPPRVTAEGEGTIYVAGSSDPRPGDGPFVIPGVRAVDLVGRWPVLVSRVILSQAYEQPGPPRATEWERRTIFTVHAHGRRDSFASLLTPSAFRYGSR